MKYILSTLIILVVSFLEVPAQLLPLMLNNRDNAAFVNPAMPGVALKQEIGKRPQRYYKTIIGFSSRKQWTGFEQDGPFTNYFKASRRFNTQKRGKRFLWATAFALTDKTGPTSLTSYGVNLSYHIDFNDYNYLAAGLTARVSNENLNRADLILDEGGANDDLIDGFQNRSFLNTGFGMLYSNTNFYIGASLPNTVLFNREQDRTLSTLSNHYYFVGGLYINVDEATYVEPSVWYRRADNLKDYYDIGIKLNRVFYGSLGRGPKHLLRQGWVGIGYDAARALRGEVGLLYDMIKFTFIYNHYLSNPGGTFGSGFELGINLILI